MAPIADGSPDRDSTQELMMTFRSLKQAFFCAITGLAAFAGTEVRGGFAVYVTNLNAGTVSEIDSTTGAITLTFGMSNLSNPRGIVFGPNGNLFVNDISTNSVQEFTAGGTPVTTFVPKLPNGPTQPYGMVFSGGNLFVSSFATNNVLEYNGTTGALIGPFAAVRGPTGLITDSSGNIFVASSTGNAVNEYSATGTLLRTFLGGGLTAPSGLAIANGILFVADGLPGSNTITEFNAATGATVGMITDSHISGPGGLAIGPDGNLYVASTGNNAVDVFNSTTGAFVSSFTPAGLNVPVYLAIASVPEPSSIALLTIGALGIGLVARRSMRKAMTG
jgi:DNA-binding beta-propeller fold protein YncE